MRKTIFDQIHQALTGILDEQGKPVIKHIDLWNQQLINIEGEQAFNTPAVFIEFAPITWKYLPHGVREANIQVTLHVVTDSRVGHWSETIRALDLSDTIHTALFGLSFDDGVHTMNTLTHLQSITDHEFDELQDNQEIYTCPVRDASAYKKKTIPGSGVVLSPSVHIQ